MRIKTSRALFIQGLIGRVLVDKNIISAWEQFLKGDECQGLQV